MAGVMAITLVEGLKVRRGPEPLGLSLDPPAQVDHDLLG